MSTKDFLEKDYYKALGVAKTAKPAEIKAAYRKLARKYHPDANKGDTSAEERFKEISEAYSVLSDEKRRKEYDEARSLFGGGFRVPPAPARASGGFGGFDLGDIFSGAGDAGGRLGDLLGGVFGSGRTHRAEPAAPGCRRRDRGHAELQRRDRRDHGGAAADRRGSLSDVPRHRRQGGHRAEDVPDLPGNRPVEPEPRLVRYLRAVQGVPRPRPGGGRPLPGLLGQRPGDELAHHPDAHPGRGR